MLDESQQLDFIREVTDALREEPNEVVEELFADYEEEDKSPYPDILSAVLISHQWRLGIPSCDLRQVVVSPLIALMKDQVDALERKGIPVTLINSTVGRGETEKRLKGMADGAYKLVYVAPERFRIPRSGRRWRRPGSRWWRLTRRTASASGDMISVPTTWTSAVSSADWARCG